MNAKLIVSLVLLGAALASAQDFLIKTSEDKQFYFVLRAANNEVVLVSELYKTAENARNGIVSVLKNAHSPSSFERRESTKKEPYFVVKAGNGEIIGNSEMYKKEGGRDHGVDAVKKAVEAIVDSIVKNVILPVGETMKQLGEKQACSIGMFKSTKDGKVYFHMKGGNGEIILASEGYSDASGAKNGIASVLKNGGNARSFDVKAASNGEKYMTLMAGNEKVIGVTETLKGDVTKSRSAIAACVENVLEYGYARTLQVGGEPTKVGAKTDSKADTKGDSKDDKLPDNNTKQQKLAP